MVKCDMKFDKNPYRIYLSGQIVSGKVDIILDKPKTVRGVAIKISGFAKTLWTELTIAKNGGQKQSETYSAREDYISSKVYVVGSDDGDPVVLNPGIHTYNFAFSLPSTIPSSFEGSFGYIRYTIKVIFDQPWKFDQTYTEAFTVIKPVDLNYESPILRLPNLAIAEKQTWFDVCSSNALSVRINIPQTGFVPGQLIPFEVTVSNGSSFRVKNIQVGLQKISTYYSRSPKEHEKLEIVYVYKKSIGEIARRTSKCFQEVLPVPPTPPTSVFFCKILHVVYNLELIANIAGFNKDLCINVPITIGTVPFITITVTQPAASSHVVGQGSGDSNNLNLSVMKPIKTGQSLEDNSDILPPSYEEATHTQQADITDEDQYPITKSHFIPRYPVYRYGIPSAPSISQN